MHKALTWDKVPKQGPISSLQIFEQRIPDQDFSLSHLTGGVCPWVFYISECIIPSLWLTVCLSNISWARDTADGLLTRMNITSWQNGRSSQRCEPPGGICQAAPFLHRSSPQIPDLSKSTDLHVPSLKVLRCRLDKNPEVKANKWMNE